MTKGLHSRVDRPLGISSRGTIVNRINRWLRRIIARSYGLDHWIRQRKPWEIGMAALVTPFPAGLLVLSVMGFRISLVSALAIGLMIVTVFPCIFLLLRNSEIATRQHLWDRDLEDAGELALEIQHQHRWPATVPDLPAIVKFVDPFYQGVTPAAPGVKLRKRLGSRKLLYHRFLGLCRSSFVLMGPVYKQEPIEGVSLLLPLTESAARRYCKGFLPYVEFQSEDVIRETSATSRDAGRKELNELTLFLGVLLASYDARRRFARSPSSGAWSSRDGVQGDELSKISQMPDLLGRLLVEHVSHFAEIYRPRTIRLITSGYGGKDLDWLDSRGFRPSGGSDYDDFRIFILDEAATNCEPAMEFFKAVRSRVNA